MQRYPCRIVDLCAQPLLHLLLRTAGIVVFSKFRCTLECCLALPAGSTNTLICNAGGIDQQLARRGELPHWHARVSSKAL